MKNLWKLELPYPKSSINKRIKYLHGKSRFTAKGKEHAETRDAFKKEVWVLFKASQLSGWSNKVLKVTIELYMPDKRKRDLDGILKELLDSMQEAGIYDDDYNIRKLTVERMDEIVKLGKVIVIIEEA
jgi:crossover junction endodeoxyribonuclease RusA